MNYSFGWIVISSIFAISELSVIVCVCVCVCVVYSVVFMIQMLLLLIYLAYLFLLDVDNVSLLLFSLLTHLKSAMYLPASTHSRACLENT